MSKMIQIEKELLDSTARSWNNLDTKYIENVIAEDVVYESQWVFQAKHGKTNVLTHLNLKFEAIRESMQSEVMAVSAEIATLPGMGDRFCIVITQVTSEVIREAILLLKIQDQEISRIDICFIPNPSEAILTGEFPI